MTPTNRPGTALTFLTLAVLCIIWGTTWAVIRVGLEGIPPFTGVSIRFGISFLILLVAAKFLRVPLGRSKRERTLWFVNGACSFAISYGVVYWSEQTLPSGLVATLFATYPLFVALIGHMLIPSERIRGAEGWFILLSFIGVVVIFSEDLSALAGENAALTALIALCAPMAAALGSVWVKRFGSDLHPISVTAVPMGIAAGITGALALGFERDAQLVFDLRSMSALGYLTIFGTVITFSLYYWLMLHLPVKRLALTAYVIPMIAVGVGVMIGEPFTIRIAIGGGLVILGLILTTWVRS